MFFSIFKAQRQNLFLIENEYKKATLSAKLRVPLNNKVRYTDAL